MGINPLFSVIIPTCDRNDSLVKCLDCLKPGGQSFPADRYEVIVADDGAKMPAEKIVKEKYPWAKWIEGPRRGVAANRNNAIRYASGEWLVFIDDDCVPDKDWMDALAQAAERGKPDVVEGAIIMLDEPKSPFHYGIENTAGGGYWTGNLAIRREKFFEIGSFDEDFPDSGGEDMEFAYRIKRYNLETVFCRKAVVRHPAYNLNLRSLIRKAILFRSLLLYFHKVGAAAPLTAGPGKALAKVTFNIFSLYLRKTWHVLTRPQKRWGIEFLLVLLQWYMLPVALPYFMMWEIHLRKQLSGKDRIKVSASTTPEQPEVRAVTVPPLISVIIPTCNRNESLSKCLDRVGPGAQTLSAGQYEVIVTDDSFPGTAEELIKIKYPWAKWTRGPRKARGTNRNNGARYANGKWFVFTDDDCQPANDWLANFAKAMDSGVLALEGSVYPIGDVDQDMMQCPVNTSGGCFWSANIAVERTLFENIGGFDENYPFDAPEDIDLKLRILEHTKIRFVPEARIYHPVVPTSLKKELLRIPKLSAGWAYHTIKNKKSLGLRNNFDIIRNSFIVNAMLLWHSLKKSQFKMIIFSAALIVIGIPLLWYNLVRQKNA